MAEPDAGNASAERRLELFRVLVEEAREYAIYLLEPDGRVASWNSGAERMKGYTEAEITGRNFSVFFPAEAVAKGVPAAELAQAADDGRFEGEGWRVRKDGSRFWASVVLTAIHDVRHELIGFTKLTRDLTEQHAARAAVRRTEQSLGVTLRSIGDGLIATDSQSRVTLMNVVAEKLTGWSLDDARGRALEEVFPIVNEHTRARAENPVNRALREGRIVGLANHTVLIARDGSERPIADSASPITEEDGSTRGVVLIFRDQTAERTAETALRESEARLRLMVDGVKEYALYMLDASGRVASWNPGAERIGGYAADEIVGRPITIFFSEEDRAAGKPERLLAEAASAGKVEDEGWQIRKDGTRFWAGIVLSAVRDEEGQLLGYAKLARDLTERRIADARERELFQEQAARSAAEAAAEHLRQSEERYRALSERLNIVLEGVADGIVMQDRALRVTYANSPAARGAGYATPDALRAAPLLDFASRFRLFDGNDRELSYDAVPSRRVLAGEDPAPLQVHVRDQATGRDWWSSIQARAVHDSRGEVEAVVSIWHDTTTQRRREEELRFLADVGVLLASDLDLGRLLEHLAGAIVPRLADWCAIDLLDHGELRPLALAHRDPEKVALARTLRARFPPDPAQAQGAYQVARTGHAELYRDIPPALLAAITRGPEHLELLRGLGLSSAMVVPITARDAVGGVMTLVGAESGRRYDDLDLGFAEELGRRAGLAVDNARLYDDARTAIRVRDDFLSIAGHELKTPLAALFLQLESLGRAAERGGLASETARLKERLKKTLHHARRLEDLVRELLDVTQITAGRLTLHKQPCNLGATVRDVLSRFGEQLADTHAELIFQAEPNVVGSWDPLRIDEVVTNLVSNAIKYGEGKPIEVTVLAYDGTARVTVRDHGIGISPKDHARIFGRFERAVSERHYGGFGLGLWIVRQLVQGHGGEVRLESRAGAGSTFTVELPLGTGSSS